MCKLISPCVFRETMGTMLQERNRPSPPNESPSKRFKEDPSEDSLNQVESNDPMNPINLAARYGFT